MFLGGHGKELVEDTLELKIVSAEYTDPNTKTQIYTGASRNWVNLRPNDRGHWP